MDAPGLLLVVLIVITGFAGVSLAASLPLETTTPPAASSQDGASAVSGLWLLDKASKLGTIPGGVTLSLRREPAVNPASLHVSGFTGLNYYVSDALVDPGQQRFILSSKLTSTDKWGGGDDMQFDKAYLDALDGVVRFHLGSAQDMTLTTLNGDTLHFRKISN